MASCGGGIACMTIDEAIEVLGGTLEPTDEEKHNGWSSTTLTLYFAERKIAADERIHNPKPLRPQNTNHGFHWI